MAGPFKMQICSLIWPRFALVGGLSAAIGGGGRRVRRDYPSAVRDCINSILVHACARMNRAGCASRPFIHDPLDGVSAAAALGAASEAGIDLAHAGPSRLFCDH